MSSSLRKSLFTVAILTASAGTVAIAAGLNPFARKAVSTAPVIAPLNAAASSAQGDVDIVFTVDTTGSMSGLLKGAKATIWSIAKHTQKLAGNVKIRVGLVAYRDVGDEYVTKTFQLSDDLDAVFAELTTYQASGGGDTPENVNKGLDEAINKMQWGRGSKMIFLVGDAPPAQRDDAPSAPALAKMAAAKGITINTIQCGNSNAGTDIAWKEIASLSNGDYSMIEQSGGVQEVATPYDTRLAEIADSIDSTVLVYGSASDRAKADKTRGDMAAAPAPAKAARASFNSEAGGTGSYGASDIVANVAQGKMALDSAAPASLPAELVGKSAEEQTTIIKSKAAKRKQLEADLASVQQQRDEWMRTNAAPSDAAFDSKVKNAVERSLKK
jgi:Mg-chelatase subunit ChlD